MRKIGKSVLAMSTAAAMLTANLGMAAFGAETVYEPVKASDVKIEGFYNNTAQLKMELYARYNSGAMSKDGGSMEIVEYNAVNGYAYSVSGLKGKVVATKIYGVNNADKVNELNGQEYDIKSLVEGKVGEGFVYGDTTSVAVSPDGTKLAVAIQHEEYDKAGVVAVFDCKEDGTIANPVFYKTGVQPDMVTFAGNNVVLTADEGEPRNGYGEGAVDPEGTVSVINLEKSTGVQAGFDKFGAKDMTDKNIIMGVVNGTTLEPKYDFEPEYIAVSSDGTKAYVALQEANAIAVLDLSKEQPDFTGIYSVGYEDYSKVPVDIDKSDEKYEAKTYTDIIGARMPDGISIYEAGGKTYIITANEGDSRDWGEDTDTAYCNEKEAAKGELAGGKVVLLDPDKCAGLPKDKKVLFGGRSFSILEVTESGLTEVYDSRDDFEKITAEVLPDYFNASNDKKDIDDRSGKKGPEPENVTIGAVGEKTYAFIAIERIGGIMVYDITNPSKSEFVNYINSRDFEKKIIQGDVSPEGLCFVQDNGNGRASILAACEVSGTVVAYELTDKDEVANKGKAVALYTNDVHNAYERDDKCLGYAAVASYAAQLRAAGYSVTIIDGGDAIQGGVIGTLSKGQYLVEIMEQTGYDIAVPGNHEFDFGMDTFLALAEGASYDYVSCNFVDLKTNKPVFDAYKTVDYNGTKVAYVGITTPETFFKSTPTYFQDDKGNYIYGFCEGNNGKDLYAQVQKSIDAAKAEGAEYVIAVGHIGTDESSAPWTSKEIIANTTGLTGFLDAHSHSTIPSENVNDKNGNPVLLCSTGTKLESIGHIVLDTATGAVSSKLITEVQFDDRKVVNFTNKITEKFDSLQKQVVAKTDVNLVIKDPKTGDRLIRTQETNLGDLCADAYKSMLEADIAFVNGGGIRVDINEGDITYGDIVSVHPFGNKACLVEATGQEILDALEMGSKAAGAGESGGFLQVSGITYEINTTIPSSVVCDDKGAFVKVDGKYRVQNVMVGDEPLDLKKTYKLASHDYMLKSGGDGFSMFMDNKVLLDEVMIDNQVLINYIVDELGGHIKSDSIYANTYGNGRIKVITEYKAATDTEDGYMVILKGSETVKEIIKASGNTDEESGDKTGEDKGDIKPPVTGDTANAAVYIMLAAAVAAAFAAVNVKRKKA